MANDALLYESGEDAYERLQRLNHEIALSDLNQTDTPAVASRFTTLTS